MSLIRTVLVIANKNNLDVHQMDVKTAFLNGTLDKEVYMKIPEGMKCAPQLKVKKVLKLKKALYGLKIGPKKWFERFTEEMIKLGLENDLNEPCLFTWRKNGLFIIVIIYVDDILLTGNDIEKIILIKISLCNIFSMKDLGEPDTFLGLKIIRNKEMKEMKIQQSDYIEKMLTKFNMFESKPKDTPMVTRQAKNKNNKINSEIRKPTNAPYRAAIGSLLYLSGATRPDIAYAVNRLARKQLSPTEEDWEDVKRVFRYLKGSIDLGLIYKGASNKMEAITDSSFQDCEESGTTGGYLIKLFGDTIAWKSHKLRGTCKSTCHAEYLAMSEVCDDIVCFDKAIRDMLGRTMYPVTIWTDNKSAKDCVYMEGSHKLKGFDYEKLDEIEHRLKERENTGTKLPMTKKHGDYVKLCAKEKKIEVKWVASNENEADIMTKPLPQKSHNYLRNKIMNLKGNEY